MTPNMCNKYPHYAGDVINSSVPGKQFLTVREPVGVAAMGENHLEASMSNRVCD